VDPAARVGKITGMLLEMDLEEIVPLLFFPDMVRSTSPKPSTLRAHSPTRPVARGLLQLLDKVKEAQGVLDLAHADDDRSGSPDLNPCAESADGFEASAQHLKPCRPSSNLASKDTTALQAVLAPSYFDILFTIQPGRRQDPKLVSSAKISDATQVVQFTVKPLASAPKSNINETQSGKVQKTMDQVRQGAPVCALHDSHTCDPCVALSHC